MSDTSKDRAAFDVFRRVLGQAAKLGPEALALTLIHGSIHFGAHLLGVAVTATGSVLPKVRRDAKPKK